MSEFSELSRTLAAKALKAGGKQLLSVGKKRKIGAFGRKKHAGLPRRRAALWLAAVFAVSGRRPLIRVRLPFRGGLVSTLFLYSLLRRHA